MRFASHRAAAAVLAATVTALPAAADEILLKGGGRLQGVVVERTEKTIVVETGPGRVTLPLSRVERIVEGRSALESFRERAAELAPGDAAGWASLARWAAERDLATQSREAWTQVLRVDPSDPEANAALGRVELDGDWMSEDEAWRARGYVQYDGRWMTPAEHEALVRQRAAEDAAERERREADLRVREAEARAREAEARAREAEAAAEQPWSNGGIPLWWGWGDGVARPPVDPGLDHPAGHPPGHPPGRPPVVTPPVDPNPTPPPATPPPRAAPRTKRSPVKAPRPPAPPAPRPD